MISSSIEKFEINPPPPTEKTPIGPSRLPKIIALIQDDNPPLADILHLITIEIAQLVAAMDLCLRSGGSRSESQLHFTQINALRVLFKHLVENRESTGRDELDIEGPKFQCAFEEIVDCLTDALEHVTKKPKNESYNQMILREFRDCLAVRQQDIQRKVDEIGHRVERPIRPKDEK
jgi:hypothetical protein